MYWCTLLDLGSWPVWNTQTSIVGRCSAQAEANVQNPLNPSCQAVGSTVCPLPDGIHASIAHPPSCWTLGRTPGWHRTSERVTSRDTQQLCLPMEVVKRKCAWPLTGQPMTYPFLQCPSQRGPLFWLNGQNIMTMHLIKKIGYKWLSPYKWTRSSHETLIGSSYLWPLAKLTCLLSHSIITLQYVKFLDRKCFSLHKEGLCIL